MINSIPFHFGANQLKNCHVLLHLAKWIHFCAAVAHQTCPQFAHEIIDLIFVIESSPVSASAAVLCRVLCNTIFGAHSSSEIDDDTFGFCVSSMGELRMGTQQHRNVLFGLMAYLGHHGCVLCAIAKT